MKKQSIKASEFDKKFDDGDSVIEYLDFKTIIKPGNQLRRIHIDFPEWMIIALDSESKRLGISFESLIKVFLSEKLKNENV